MGSEVVEERLLKKCAKRNVKLIRLLSVYISSRISKVKIKQGILALLNKINLLSRDKAISHDFSQVQA